MPFLLVGLGTTVLGIAAMLRQVATARRHARAALTAAASSAPVETAPACHSRQEELIVAVPDFPRADERATALTRARYERLAPAYDVVEGMLEVRYRPWRTTFWQQVTGLRILEVGVGTG